MNVRTELRCTTKQDLPEASRYLLETWPDARIFAFIGSMGSGKTTFIQSICKELEATDPVNSPSFSIVNEYNTKSGKKIFHFDFYRIKNITEAMDIGFESYFYSDSYCFIEWPEKVIELLPDNSVYITIDVDEITLHRIISF